MNRTTLVREDVRRALAPHVGALEALRGTQVCVTGGTGFMGSWLAEAVACLNDDHAFGIRLMLLSRRAHRFRDKAPHLADRKDLSLTDRDVRALTSLPEDTAWIVHAAATPDNRQHASDPMGVMRTIQAGTWAVLEASTRLGGLRKVLNISSGLVYGPQPLEHERVAEGDFFAVDCANPRAAYARAKAYAETLAAVHCSQMKTPVTTVRPFTFMGPYQLLDRPWANTNFLRDALQGGAVRIQGDGETVRSFLYAADMAAWLLAALVKGGEGAVYNLGSPHGHTLTDLAGRIADRFTPRPEVVTDTAPHAAVHRSRLVPDVSLVGRELGLMVTFDLDTAVERTLAWHRLAPKAEGARG